MTDQLEATLRDTLARTAEALRCMPIRSSGSRPGRPRTSGPGAREPLSSPRSPPLRSAPTASPAAAGAGTRPIAFRAMVAEKDTHRVIVLAPGAARATVTVGQRTAPVSLDATGFGETVVDPGEEATVAAVAPDGTSLGETPIPRN
jgi:hypothetical protein